MKTSEIRTAIELSKEGFNEKEIKKVLGVIYKEEVREIEIINPINSSKKRKKANAKDVLARRQRIYNYVKANGEATIRELIINGVVDNKKNTYNDIKLWVKKQPHIKIDNSQFETRIIYEEPRNVSRYF